MAGRHAEALPLLEKLRGERPDDRELLTYLGGTYAVAGRTAEAVTLLDKVLAAHPDDFDATMNLATARMLDRDYEPAAALVQRALAIRAGDPDATRLRGVVAWRAGRLDDAERWLAEAAVLNPRDAKALAWIGDIRRARGRHAAALTAYRDALAVDPLLPDALIGAAAMAVATGARDDAARWLARARRLAPGRADLADVERQLAGAARP
jgi:tetratricopeptide (TPR) repeat protein